MPKFVLSHPGCEILVKAEFLNCGGSVKDRAALYLIKDAEKKGTSKHTSTVYMCCVYVRSSKTWWYSGGRDCWKYW